MKFAIIGSPIEHSLSPALHNWAFDELGLDAEYRPAHVDTRKLPQMVEQLRKGDLDGINVTIPHKRHIMPLLDEIHFRAQDINAINCVVRRSKELVGYNTDWYGFKMTLRRNRIKVSGRICVILGAGGAARSIAYALANEDADKVFVVNRTVEKAENLVTSFNRLNTRTSFLVSPFEGLKELLSGREIVINSTPIGMWPEVNFTPLRDDVFHRDQILIDVIYTPLKTLFLKSGDESEAQTINGLTMFIYQGLASLDLWFGESISEQIDVNKLEKYLIRQLPEFAAR